MPNSWRLSQHRRSVAHGVIALALGCALCGLIGAGDSPSPSFSDSEIAIPVDARAAISALDVSPDGRLIAVSGAGEALLLDASAGLRGARVIVHRLRGAAQRIESIRFSPEGARIAVAGGLPGESGELQVWDVATGRQLLSHEATDDVLRGVAWSADGKRIAFGGADTNVYVIDAASGERVLEQGAHADCVLASAFSLDGQYIVSGSRDQTLKLIETTTGRFVDNVTAVSPGVPGGPIFTLARHPHTDLVAVGGGEGAPRTYMMHRLVERKIGDDNNLVRAYPAMPGRIFAVAFSPDGRRLAAASSDGHRGRVEWFAVPEATEPPKAIRAIQRKTVDERSEAETAQLAAYHRQGAVRLAFAAGRMGPVYAAAFLRDGATVVSGGAEGVLRFHDATHGTLVAEVSPSPQEASLVEADPDARGSHGDGRVRFLTDVMPIIGKLGCNAGTCHGAREGQNGFQLSLRGYDPLADYRSLTDDLASRRTNRAHPESSLMLLKATGTVSHGGGMVVEPDSRRYDVLQRWIAQGAAYDAAAPRVTSIEVAPRNPVLQLPGESLRVQVTARYSDGSTRDVTDDAFVESGDPECATASAAGEITAVRRGEAAILARYEGAYAATMLTVMGDRSGFAWSAPPAYNPIDELVDAKLRRMQIAPGDLCSDVEFLRRVHLDLTGMPPTADEIREFLADSRESRAKRNEVIEALIGSDDYVEHWTNRWADLLMVNGKFLGGEGAAGFRAWIRTAVAENWPYDRFVQEIMTATGSNREHPAASYFKVLRSAEQIAETTTQVFLGVRFNCNKCHDHPFERWTQDDYYSWAAYFADVKLQKDPASGDRTIAGSAVESPRPLYETVVDAPGGQTMHLRTGQPARPRFPYPAAAPGLESPLRRREAAAWLTSPENRYFASSYANRLWAYLLGVGLIEPIDDIRAGNPPSNPELLDWLTEEFIASGFDAQHVIRTICQSRTYQLSSATHRWNEDDRRNYSHALPRRLPAEALYDAVHRAVGSTPRLPGVPPGTRAAALPDSMIELESGLLSKLGRPERESGCECERSGDLSLGPVMALVNGPTFAAAISDPDNDLARLEAALPDNAILAREVYLRVLGRFPNDQELADAVRVLSMTSDDLSQVQSALEARVAEIDLGFDQWRRDNRPIDWTVLKAVESSAAMGSALESLEDGSILANGAEGKGAYRVVAAAPVGEIRALRLEAFADDALPSHGPGRAPNGNFVLSQLRLFVVEAEGATPRRLKLRTAEADFSQAGYHVSGAIDGKPDTGWAVAGGVGQSHVAGFALARPVTLRAGALLVVELDHQYDAQHLLGRFRLSVADETEALLRPDPPDMWRPLLAAWPQELPADDVERLRGYYRSLDEDYRALEQAVNSLGNSRLAAVQDLAWALINSPAFLFNY